MMRVVHWYLLGSFDVHCEQSLAVTLCCAGDAAHLREGRLRLQETHRCKMMYLLCIWLFNEIILTRSKRQREFKLTVCFLVCWLMPSGPMTSSIVMFQLCCKHRTHTDMCEHGDKKSSQWCVRLRHSPPAGRWSSPVCSSGTEPEWWRSGPCTGPGSVWSSPGTSAGSAGAAAWADNTHVELEMNKRKKQSNQVNELKPWLHPPYLHAVNQLFWEEQVQTHVPPDGADTKRDVSAEHQATNVAVCKPHTASVHFILPLHVSDRTLGRVSGFPLWHSGVLDGLMCALMPVNASYNRN